MTRFPDNPTRISAALLKRLDADAPGTWLAQPKYNGWRCVIWSPGSAPGVEQQWVYASKYKTGPRAKPPPKELRKALEALFWPETAGPPPGCAFDAEWMGPRGGTPHFVLFDLVSFHEWLGNMPFQDRYDWLADLYEQATTGHSMGALDSLRRDPLVKLAPCWRNPGLHDRYLEQLQDPLSEGLVLRRADSKLIGSFDGPADNPQWFKVKYKG
jgi:hypothetical protein